MISQAIELLARHQVSAREISAKEIQVRESDSSSSTSLLEHVNRAAALLQQAGYPVVSVDGSSGLIRVEGTMYRSVAQSMIERVLRGEDADRVLTEQVRGYQEGVEQDAEAVQNELGSDYEVKVLQGDDDPFGPPLYSVSKSGEADLGVLYSTLRVIPGKSVEVQSGTSGIGGESKTIYGSTDPSTVARLAKKYVF